MKHRSPIAVFFLSIITLGIYSIYWLVKTKGELNAGGAKIPTAWLIIIPFVNIWWMWKYAEGVELVAKEKMSGIVAFILLWLLGAIGMAIIQNTYNGLAAPTATETAAAAPLTPDTEPAPSAENTPAAEATPAPAVPTPETPPTPAATETPSDQQQTPPAQTPPTNLVQ